MAELLEIFFTFSLCKSDVDLLNLNNSGIFFTWRMGFRADAMGAHDQDECQFHENVNHFHQLERARLFHQQRTNRLSGKISEIGRGTSDPANDSADKVSI